MIEDSFIIITEDFCFSSESKSEEQVASVPLQLSNPPNWEYILNTSGMKW